MGKHAIAVQTVRCIDRKSFYSCRRFSSRQCGNASRAQKGVD